MKRFALFFALAFLAFWMRGDCQIFRGQNEVQFAFGAKLTVGLLRDRASFSHLSFVVSARRGWKWGDSDRFIAAPIGQLTANIYSKGIGASAIERLNNRPSVDFLISFLALGGWDEPTRRPRQRFLRTFNQLTAVGIWHELEASAHFGTSFLLNNRGRNQQLGHLGGNCYSVIFGYYNDGTPFEKTPLADLYDRFWTGGGHLAVDLWFLGDSTFRIQPDSYLEFAYDRFTGDAQEAYKLSKDLLLYGIPQANEADIFLNRSLFSAVLRHSSGSCVGLSFLGQTKDDVQDKIHKKFGYSRHISYSKNSWGVVGAFQKNY